VREMLNALDQEMTEQVSSASLIDCEGNDLFRFLSDLGELGASHPHLMRVRDVVGTLLMNIQGQGKVDYYSLRGRVPFPRLVTILFYLQDLGLVRVLTESTTRGNLIREILIPPGTLIQKAFLSMEASTAWEEHREPNLILAYILVKGLHQTRELVESKGFLEIGEGITRLYVTQGRVLIPRQFGAPFAFILCSWANGQDEVQEDEIKEFLSLRGITSHDRDKIFRIIAGVQPGQQHTIYRLERFSYGNGDISYRLILNPRFRNLRDRLRGRLR
jgi:hypothetical protein